VNPLARCTRKDEAGRACKAERFHWGECLFTLSGGEVR